MSLSASHLAHRFGERLALDGVSFELAPASIMGLVGRNGAGKTTTMRAVMGIIRPDAGVVRWQEHPIGPHDRLRFGYMPEERGLYPQMRLQDQVRYFARLHGLRATAAERATAVWLTALGLADRAGDRLDALSHGNQQRAQLAVALVHDPKVLVLDEPFSGLDPAAVDQLTELLAARAAAGVAVLVSSHQLDLVERLCKAVVVLDRGRVLASGSLEALRDRLPARLRIDVPSAPAGWAAHLPGTGVAADRGDGVLLSLEPGTDPQRILLDALAIGPVHHFGFEVPSLADVYRHLVTA